jgi:hypothetical protein
VKEEEGRKAHVSVAAVGAIANRSKLTAKELQSGHNSLQCTQARALDSCNGGFGGDQ